MPKFIMFLSFLCLNKFIGGTEGAANFLLGVRCVEKKDKAVSIGLSMALISFFAVATSPTFFGWIIDETCIFWGKNCNSAKGNCWLYNTESMRYNLNMTAAAFVFIGTCFDIGTWKYSKDVQIFDENEEK
jgi:solute carrier organic anion transporter family, member 5A